MDTSSKEQAAPRQFTEKERAILKIVQKNLPDSLTPYATIAQETGSTEDDVLALLQSMKEDSSIRRFGASLKHQKAGVAYNVMVAWEVLHDKVDAIGKEVATNTMVSHCYFRPSSLADWPYELYTMLHGQNPSDCQAIIEKIAKTPGVGRYALLESLKELKKTSMTYF